MKSIKVKWILKGIVFGVLLISVLTFATMWLWNNLAVALFGLPAIGFFQALGLMVLGRLLSGGFGPRGWRGGKHRFMRERWKNMSADEREQFRNRWGQHGWKPKAENSDMDPEAPKA